MRAKSSPRRKKKNLQGSEKKLRKVDRTFAQREEAPGMEMESQVGCRNKVV